MRFYGPWALERGRCPYLPDRRWRSISLEVEDLDPGEFQGLLEAGYRRCGSEFYVPRCEGCAECVSLRLPVDRFEPGRTQRRVWRRNRDLEVREVAPGLTDERLDLYRRYLAGRFGRAEVPGPREFEDFLGPRFSCAVELDYRLDGRLVAFGILDATPDAASSVYFVHDPALPERRLGTYSILREVEWCRESGRGHLYLGLWVRGCPSMAYKGSFGPHEVLVPGRGWQEPPA